MDEAQALADRVAVMVDGRIVALGTPARDRRARHRADRDRLRAARAASRSATCRRSTAPTSPRRRRAACAWSPREGLRTAHELTGWALERGLELRGFAVSQPSLEDVYLRLTETQEATSR